MIKRAETKTFKDWQEKVQETTFNEETQADEALFFINTQSWLSALYAQPSQKKMDGNDFDETAYKKINFENLENKIKYKFLDRKKLITALMQSTFCYEMKDFHFSSNERLEFLGDSLINFIVGKNLFQIYEKTDEGELSRLRGALVNEEKLAELARLIDLGNYLFLGKGEFKSGGSDKNSLLADTLEALFAAIYFDSKNDLSRVEHVWDEVISLYEEKGQNNFYSLTQLEMYDTKSKLQELTMARYGLLPVYKNKELPRQEGFSVEVWLGEKLLAKMSGHSKKKIEKLLAKKIIDEELY